MQTVTGDIDLRPLWRRMLSSDARQPAPRREVTAIGRAPARRWWARVAWMGAGAAIALVVRSWFEPPAPELAPAAAVVEEAPAPREVEVRVPEPEPAEDRVPALVAIPRPSTGTLELETNPPLSVYEGERRLGRTPLALQLEPGMHVLRFVDRRRHLDAKRSYRVRAGKTTKRELDFGLSELHVEAPAGAKVYLNQRFVGTAPLAPVSIFEGTHLIEIRAKGERIRDRLRVPPSRKVNYRARWVSE